MVALAGYLHPGQDGHRHPEPKGRVLISMSQPKANPLSHAAIYLVARGVPGLISFMAIPLFTRLLSPADYGRYALVAAAAALLNALIFQWLRLSMVRYLPANQQDPVTLKN